MAFLMEWKGVKFHYKGGIDIKSEHIGVGSTTLKIDRKHVAGTFVIQINGIQLIFDESGAVSADPPEGITIEIENNKKSEIELPFTLLPEMEITLSGVLSEVFLAMDYFKKEGKHK